jgi:MIP family channel proteins
LAEAGGTLVLVLFGAGSAVVDALTGGSLGVPGVATAFGATVAVAVLIFGGTSGAHINPAVTVALWAIGRFRGRDVTAYVAAQCAGATLAGVLLVGFFGPAAAAATTTPRVTASGALLLEALLSFVLMLTIVAAVLVLEAPRLPAALAIGAAVAFGALVGGQATGAGMNPARSFGPALALAEWKGHWIYWLGPLCGMLAAAAALKTVLPRRAKEPGNDAGRWLTGDRPAVEHGSPSAGMRRSVRHCARAAAACLDTCQRCGDDPAMRACAEAARACLAECSAAAA